MTEQTAQPAASDGGAPSAETLQAAREAQDSSAAEQRKDARPAASDGGAPAEFLAENQTTTEAPVQGSAQSQTVPSDPSQQVPVPDPSQQVPVVQTPDVPQ